MSSETRGDPARAPIRVGMLVRRDPLGYGGAHGSKVGTVVALRDGPNGKAQARVEWRTHSTAQWDTTWIGTDHLAPLDPAPN